MMLQEASARLRRTLLREDATQGAALLREDATQGAALQIASHTSLGGDCTVAGGHAPRYGPAAGRP
nr:hypothetical protein [Verrucomicrobiota bacterium]